MLPDPALTLTLPSIYDGTVLDCRLYHPASLAASNLHAPPWTRNAAIVAHPYAPMGGCYDDPIVDVVATQLLRKGFLVGTFNFRGAGASAGSTSWTAKPERDDYTSFVGFLVYYLHYLDPFAGLPSDDEHDAPSGSTNPLTTRSISPALIIAGYSYGAMVTTQLAPLNGILQHFAHPEAGSDAYNIRLRAHHLASQQNVILSSVRAGALDSRSLQPHSPRRGVRVGGDEAPGSPRKSHDSIGRKSFSVEAEEKLKKGVHDLLVKTKLHGAHHRHKSSHSNTSDPASTPQTPVVDELSPLADLLVPRPAYLLISPPQGVITHLATMSFLPSSLARRDGGNVQDGAEAKLMQQPTLAIYGDHDAFAPVSKLRAWSGRLQGEKDS